MPVHNTSVKITDGKIEAITETNESGEFSLNFYLIENKELTSVVSKNGFITDTTTFTAIVGDSIKVPLVKMTKSYVTINGNSYRF